MLRRILDRDLKISAAAYSFEATPLPGCETEFAHKSAFFIFQPRSISAKNVKIWTDQTQGFIQDRIRIQSIFYNSSSDPNSGSLSRPLLRLNEAQKQKLTTQYTNFPVVATDPFGNIFCSANSCQGTLILCKDDAAVVAAKDGTALPSSCLQVDAAVLPPPATPEVASRISASNLPFSDKNNFLWPDLEGKPVTPHLDQWLKKNLYACGRPPQYGPIRTVEASLPCSPYENEQKVIGDLQEKLEKPIQKILGSD